MNNLYAGISHEIGYSASIHGNTIFGNGATTYQWGWYAQIQIQNSSNTKVYGNKLTLDAVHGGNGITIIQQNRGSQYSVHDVTVTGNSISSASEDGVLAGWFVDYDPTDYNNGNNVFVGNHYHAIGVGNPSATYWVANAVGYDFAMWQSLGEDVTGSADTSHP